MNLWKFANFVFSLFYLLSKTFFVNSCWGQLNCLFVIWQAGLPSSQIVKYPYNPKMNLISAHWALLNVQEGISIWLRRLPPIKPPHIKLKTAFLFFLKTYLSPVTATKSELGSNSICRIELSKISEITEKLPLSFTSKTVNLFWCVRPTTILSVEIASFAGFLKSRFLSWKKTQFVEKSWTSQNHAPKSIFEWNQLNWSLLIDPVLSHVPEFNFFVAIQCYQSSWIWAESKLDNLVRMSN